MADINAPAAIQAGQPDPTPYTGYSELRGKQHG